MARRSLKPQLNQIRAWVQEGRTDAWIAHQLEIPASELREFRKQHDLNPDEEAASAGEVDLRDEIEAEIEAATVEETDEKEEEEEDVDEDADEDEEAGDDTDSEDEDDSETEKKPARAKKSGGGRRKREPVGRKEASGQKGGDGGEGGQRPRRRRRRGRRGGRGRRKEIEATFDHGDRDGYGLWLDPAIKDNPVYSEHWAGKRELSVRIDADQIVIRRAGEPAGGGGSDDSDD